MPVADNLDGARRAMGLSQEELWTRYFALGGSALPVEFDAFLNGALEPEAGEYDVVVHALNERSMELGLAQRWPYSDEP
jgi:hypothetical protein